MLDFSKVFGTIAHQRLLGKLWDQRQHSQLDKTLADRSIAESGCWWWLFQWGCCQKSAVPQGTALCHLMFILYINKISKKHKFQHQVICRCLPDIEALQGSPRYQWSHHDLDHLCLWACHWHMNFNPEKCSVLTITRKKNPVTVEYAMLGTKLKNYDHHPYLGVEISQDWTGENTLRLWPPRLTGPWIPCTEIYPAFLGRPRTRPTIPWWDQSRNMQVRYGTPTSRTISTCWRRCRARQHDLSAWTTAGTPVCQVWCWCLAWGTCRTDASSAG